MSSRTTGLALAIAVLFLGGRTPAWGQMQPAYPGAQCSVEPGPELKWSAQEKWVWKEICEGRQADLNRRPGGVSLPSKDEMDLPPDRVLSARFLKTILLRAPFRAAIPENGVFIIGALFEEKLDLSNTRIDAQLVFVKSQFKAPVSFAGAEFKRTVHIDETRFDQKLDLNGIQAGHFLFIHDGSQFAAVDLGGARVEGQVALDGAKFTGPLIMDAIQVSGDLLMNRTDAGDTEFVKVTLIAAKVEGHVSLGGAKFKGPLNMNGIRVGGSLLMSNAEFALINPKDPKAPPVVDLVGAEVDGQVTMAGATFKGRLSMRGIQVGEVVLMRGARFEETVSLFGSRISGALQFANAEAEASWAEGASLDLRQAQLQLIQLSEQSLPIKTAINPRPIQLQGFQYQRMVTYVLNREDNTLHEDNTLDADWYKTHWLEKSEFSSQTYKQLADVLESEDRPEVAAEILYASKEQQRTQAEGLRWINLTLQKLLIGYGYHIYQALFWFVGFVALGAMVRRLSSDKKESGLAGLAENVFFSIDWLIPIVKLDEGHYKDSVDGWQRYYFAVHILMGYVLVSFILAGVSGLTE